MARSRVHSIALALALGLAGCNACDRSPADAPLRYVSKDADAVLEIRDLGLLIEARAKLPDALKSVLTPPQLEALFEELSLTLGFDPTTREGLGVAGFPHSGPIAVELAGDGSGALWIVPIADAAKAASTVRSIVSARFPVDGTRVEKIAGRELTVLESEFGSEKAVQAAYFIGKKLGFVGLGRDAVRLVSEAVERKAEESMAESEAYRRTGAALEGPYELRLISPAGGNALARAVRFGSRWLPSLRVLEREELQQIESAGWALDFKARGIEVRGHARLVEAARNKMKALFTRSGDPGGGVLAVDLSEAVLFGQLALDPRALFEVLAPPGSDARAELERALAQTAAELGIDVEKDLLPLLTGHASAAMGIGDVTTIDLRDLARSARSLLWTAFAVGVTDPAAAIALEERLDPGLRARGLEVASRRAGSMQVRVVAPKAAGERSPDRGEVLIESFALPRAWMFANASAITDRLVEQAPGRDVLEGQPGLALELRFTELARELGNVRFGGVSILWRSLVGKVLDVVRALDRLSVRARPAGDGIAFDARLTLASSPP